jgi:hypothetical protein
VGQRASPNQPSRLVFGVAATKPFACPYTFLYQGCPQNRAACAGELPLWPELLLVAFRFQKTRLGCTSFNGRHQLAIKCFKNIFVYLKSLLLICKCILLFLSQWILNTG